MGVENEVDICCVFPESLKKDRWTLLLPDRKVAGSNKIPLLWFLHYDSDKPYSGKVGIPKIWEALQPEEILYRITLCSRNLAT